MQINTTLRNTMANAIDDTIGITGQARLYNTALTAAYATIGLANPAFGPAATGVITLGTGTTAETNASAGSATRLGFYASGTAAAGAWKVLMSLNDTGTPDVTISNNTLTAGDQVSFNSLTITVPQGTLP